MKSKASSFRWQSPVCPSVFRLRNEFGTSFQVTVAKKHSLDFCIVFAIHEQEQYFVTANSSVLCIRLAGSFFSCVNTVITFLSSWFSILRWQCWFTRTLSRKDAVFRLQSGREVLFSANADGVPGHTSTQELMTDTEHEQSMSGWDGSDLVLAVLVSEFRAIQTKSWSGNMKLEMYVTLGRNT